MFMCMFCVQTCVCVWACVHLCVCAEASESMGLMCVCVHVVICAGNWYSKLHV